MTTVMRSIYNLDQLGPDAAETERRIRGSLALPRTAPKQRERRQFWQGFITAALDFGAISPDEYRWLRDKVIPHAN